MKILYAIQGTGNGHLSRARDVIPALQKLGEVDILVSGLQADVTLPYEVKHKFVGLSFFFGKKGGVDLLATYKKSKLKLLINEINNFPIEDYDIVINDFEPVTAWACKAKNKVCIGLSHQAAVINKKSPKPIKSDVVGKTILKNYAPVDFQFGFHFEAYDQNIFTPVIRSEIRNAKVKQQKHYTVYLPAYEDKAIIKILKEFKDIEWHIFSKHSKKEYEEKNFIIKPVNNEAFLQSFVNCKGVLCGAGFETPAEALFLNKKLMVIPMKGQYEQQCNAAAIAELGVPVIKSLKIKHKQKIANWLHSDEVIVVNYPDYTDQIVAQVIKKYQEIEKIKIQAEILVPKKTKQIGIGAILKKIVE